MVLSILNDYLSDFHVAPERSARWSRLTKLHVFRGCGELVRV
jgi:hypothetical protein